ncbi:enoyl-CoA hydratase/isomerase family protein [Nocardioides sp.]|uniref:enoyl-CoA hydratase/isomerase family protein n=1 Tax=Nocardioides sp. TaxID=35761 RepID=UPI00261FBBD8|nr:enoyl-CoA hydratase/isomerase family protein [Nocardioides sp.]MCW2737961.1 paaG [Nocardioides sp.]
MKNYEGLEVEVDQRGVALVTIRGRDKVNSLDERDHLELAEVWHDLDREPEVRVIVVTGQGTIFSAGGNLDMELRIAGDYEAVLGQLRDSRLLVKNLIDCSKPIISAINGPAAGAGLAVALLADISIIGHDVEFTDGHTRIGIAAGDHASLIWPLLCGMAHAKRYLLTSERMTGQRAADIGLVSWSTERDKVLHEALEVAERLSSGPQDAIKWTKHALNLWLQQAMPTFEASLALEMMGLLGPDYKEGLTAFAEKRAPNF